MAGMNRAILIGNLGRDAELKFTNSGVAVATLNLATTDVWKDKDTGANREATEWHRVVVWGKTAEVLAEYLVKGKSICVEGKIQTREWTDKDGIKRKTTEIRADRVILLGSKNNGGGGDYKAAKPAVPADAPSPDADDVANEDDDSIPF